MEVTCKVFYSNGNGDQCHAKVEGKSMKMDIIVDAAEWFLGLKYFSRKGLHEALSQAVIPSQAPECGEGATEEMRECDIGFVKSFFCMAFPFLP